VLRSPVVDTETSAVAAPAVAVSAEFVVGQTAPAVAVSGELVAGHTAPAAAAVAAAVVEAVEAFVADLVGLPLEAIGFVADRTAPGAEVAHTASLFGADRSTADEASLAALKYPKTLLSSLAPLLLLRRLHHLALKPRW